MLFLKNRTPYVLLVADASTGDTAAWRAAARASLARAVTMNVADARFALLRTSGGPPGSTAASEVLVKGDDPDANVRVLKALADENALLPPGGTPSADVPLTRMVSDAAAEAARLSAADSCTRVVVVLIVGSGHIEPGDGAASAAIAAAAARDVPFDVLAVAPGAAESAELRSVAERTAGSYVEVTRAALDAANGLRDAFASPIAGTTVVPEMTAAANEAVRQGHMDTTTSTADMVVASPVVGTANLDGAHGMDGQLLPLTVVRDSHGTDLPQRDNVMITAALSMPGFDGRLRAFRSYKPIPDSTRPSGYAFVSDGTSLWVGSVPGPDRRNLYTATADGRLVRFASDDPRTLAAIAAMMRVSPSSAAQVIARLRALPLGAILDSRPVMMGPPALLPAPDADYVRFAASLERRRSLVWIGTNGGFLECIDARLGVEVWGFIPPNLLARLPRLLLGQAMTDPTLLMDGPIKIANVKIDGSWRTHLVAGEGPGGTFYQSFDVTLADLADAVAPDSDDIDAMLAYFAAPDRIRLNWSFPKYADFDASIAPYGDVRASAPAIEKTVGQTWSEPAVGRIGASGPDVVLVGSGFLPASVGAQPNRSGQVAGTTFYALNAADGSVLASATLDGVLQPSPVAVGPAGSPAVTRAYLGTLNGSVWRVDLSVDPSGRVLVGSPVRLWDGGAAQPIVGSMAAVNVGGTRQYLFFGTGSDLLPSAPPPGGYRLVGLLDEGGSGRVTFEVPLAAGPNGSVERASAFPAVAGDVVFFATTVRTTGQACGGAEARLYAFTYAGGAAYDTTGDGRLDGQDAPLVTVLAARRATAPAVADRHVMLGAGDALAVLGDPRDYDGALARTGIRVLSWRRASP
ncbi:MAG: hypothetical protein ACM3SQ_17070 [Betaproteobacteria bacterium]